MKRKGNVGNCIMKKFNKTILLFAAAMLVVSILAGCVSMEDKIAEIAGVWVTESAESEENARMILENIDLYEEEIALVDLSSFDSVMLVEFKTDRSYRFSYDIDATKVCVREFYLGAFKAMYDGRASLADTYEVDFSEYTEEEFYQFYADLYEQQDFDTLINSFVEGAFDYEILGQDFETGTFTITGNNIMCTITGESEAAGIEYALVDGKLNLHFTNADMVMERAK